MAYTPTTWNNGDVITAEKLNKLEKGVQNEQVGPAGPQGPQGPQGETGATPQLTIGTVTTLDPGEDATVTITGTEEAPVLNFGIPKGEPGEDGSAGLPTPTQADAGKVPMVNEDGTGYVLREVSAGGGDAGQPGTDGEDGGYYTPSVDTAGNLSWTPSKVGMPSVPEANIRGPQGPQGIQGDSGAQGPQGEPGPQGETGPQGPEGPPYTLTEEDKQTIVQTVLAALPDGDAVSYGTPEPGIVATDNRYYTAIAAAIREKLGTSTEYQPAQMAAAIESIGVMPGIPVTVTGNPVNITDSVEWPLLGLKVYGKSTQDGTSSPKNPVPIANAGASGSIETVITGKNLLAGRRYYGTYSNAKPYIQNETEVSLPYKPEFETMGICYLVSVKKNTTYTFSVTNPNANAKLFVGLYLTEADTKSASKCLDSREASLFYATYTATKDGFLVCMIGGTWTDGSTTTHECTESELLQLEIGSTATAYEAPHSQSIVAATPNGLPGIPVDSGGNYTDAEGQQRACDVKDYSIGKYTQMVGHIESYNGETITTPYMSTTGQLSTGAEVYYVLDEPVVTDISAEELAAYRALHTYDGATVVSTAEDVAGLDIRYVADAQKYIDNRLTAAESHIQEIAAAQLNAQTGG